MTRSARFTLRGRNPDVLSCIANLSNDEVFTPPEFANRMLDTLAEGWAASHNGADIWADPTVTFLDPCTKSGVFLREITRRLIDGLAPHIPDLEARVEHILTKQVYGIAITQITSLLARRSLYCSKHAQGSHSIAKTFASDAGNVWFERLQHTWDGDKCRYCGAGKIDYDRGDSLESHAYLFTHQKNIKQHLTSIFGGVMQFDVIIGNPPYQLDTGGSGRQATPIYQQFVEQAKKLEPKFLSFVIPSRWFAGGMGLSQFREKMLSDRQLVKLVDFTIGSDAFPKVNINGGVCYFLWSNEQSGVCEVTTVAPGGVWGQPVRRPLDEFDIFIRRNEAISIIRKIQLMGEKSFASRISTIDPFGLPTKFHGADKKSHQNRVMLYGSGKISWINEGQLNKNLHWLDKWKVFLGSATDGNEKYPLPIWDVKGPIVVGPDVACTWTYLVASVAENNSEAESIASFLRTKFCRFLVSIRKLTQHNKAENFLFVPDVGFEKIWTDELLYERYGLTADEIQFIEGEIRTMVWKNE
jgi:hypothetical protein